MKPLTRLRRTLRVATLAAYLYAIYKIPALARRLFGRPRATDAELSPTHRRAADAILATALAMRGVMIKACQAIATRADVFPPEMVEKLKQCHDAVPAKPFEVVRAAVERELGKPLGAVFSSFEAAPIAAASLAQVHGATLLDGTPVAVKVQYPDIEEIVRTDLRNLERLCRFYEWFDPQPLELLPLLRELTTHLGFELDFRREARSADR
ncbi:MAG: AarF/UbiB family protein, partial [Myxococcota bacterium]|nr:AarF/UbiB family protein [Myxococcota bacterium]